MHFSRPLKSLFLAAAVGMGGAACHAQDAGKGPSTPAGRGAGLQSAPEKAPAIRTIRARSIITETVAAHEEREITPEKEVHVNCKGKETVTHDGQAQKTVKDQKCVRTIIKKDVDAPEENHDVLPPPGIPSRNGLIISRL